MKRIALIAICVILVLSLSSCGSSSKYESVIKYLDSGDYDSAILEIEKMKHASSDEELITKIEIAKGIYIYTNLELSGNGVTKYSEEYSLTEVLWVTPKDCQFVYRMYSSGSALQNNYTTETFDEIIRMILNGNPKEHTQNTDSTGRMVAETLPVALKIRTKNEEGYNNYVYLDCENIEEIYARFVEMRKAVSGGGN